MKLWWALALAITACDGGASTGMDAADDGAPMPDTSAADTDGDGILDSVDVCPDVPDPAQVDLDGDHIGWMCDAVESTMIPFTGELGVAPIAARGHTMGVELSSECGPQPPPINYACHHVALTVGPGGIARAESPTDTWMDGFPMRGFVGAENRVVWSMSRGVMGDQDASTGVFTARRTGGVIGFNSGGLARFERDQLLVLQSDPVDTSINTYDFLVPQANGELTAIATSTTEFIKPTVLGHDPARLVFGVSNGTDRSVREFVPGMTTSAPVVVNGTQLSNADDVQWLNRYVVGGMFGFCVDKGNKRYLVETIDDELRAYEVPLPSCALGVQQTDDHRFALIWNGDAAVALVDGVVHSLPIAGSLEPIGNSIPAVIARRVAGENEIYVIDATGALHAMPTLMGVASNVSAEADTVHFVSRHGFADPFVLVRYRNGTTTEFVLPGLGQSERWKVFTTREGAALISSESTAFVWPSQASQAQQIDFDNIDVLIRSNATLFVASHNDPRSQPALYSYTESGGVPQYMALTPEVLQNVAFTMRLAPLGYSLPVRRDGLPPTDWFMYMKDGDCQLVRPEVTGTFVALVDNVQCSSAAIVGYTPSGDPLVSVSTFGIPERYFVLANNTLTKVAQGSYLKPYFPGPQSSVVLGWGGMDGNGLTAFVCMASHPDRCWTAPYLPNGSEVWGPLVPEHPDAFHIVFVKNSLGTFTYTSIRTFGPGDHPQPL